jgi:hypothetical protein
VIQCAEGFDSPGGRIATGYRFLLRRASAQGSASQLDPLQSYLCLQSGCYKRRLYNNSFEFSYKWIHREKRHQYTTNLGRVGLASICSLPLTGFIGERISLLHYIAAYRDEGAHAPTTKIGVRAGSA